MTKAHILVPFGTDAYIYNHTLVGHIQCEASEFYWCNMLINCSRITKWTHWIIEGETAKEANGYAQYQADRLASGMHPTYLAPAIGE